MEQQMFRLIDKLLNKEPLELAMKKILIAAACALMFTTTLAAAQSSQGKGGAPMTGETADPAKTSGAKSTDAGGMGQKPMTKKMKKAKKKTM